MSMEVDVTETPIEVDIISGVSEERVEELIEEAPVDPDVIATAVETYLTDNPPTGVTISTDDPQPSGTADPGSTGEVSDAGHVHEMPSAADVGAATTAQGDTADTALQPGDLDYDSGTHLIGENHIPSSIARDTEVTAAITALALGTASTHPATDFDPAGAAAGAVSTHVAATDPHGDRAFATSAVAALSSVYQPVDSDLTAIAALTTTSYGRAFLALADAAAGRTALGLGTAATHPSTDFDAAGAAATAQAASQPVDSDLTAIAALSTTTYGRALLTLADRAAMMTLLALTESDISGLVSDLAGKVATTLTLAGLDLSTNRTAAALKTALAITESDVSGLVTDLAAKVSTSLTLAGLDLSTNRSAAALKTALAIAQSDVSGLVAALALLAPLASPTFTGTVVVPDASFALAKLATIADQRILGNVSGGTAAVIALTATQIKTFLALVASDAGAQSVTGGGQDTVSNLGNLTGTVGIDLANGNSLYGTLTGNTTFTFTGSTNAKECEFVLRTVQDSTPRSITWPASVKWAGGSAPTISTASAAKDMFIFATRDGGTTWYGGVVGLAFA